MIALTISYPPRTHRKLTHASRTGVAEALATLGAVERFLAGVQASMLRQVVLVLERLGADVAREWTLTYK